MPGTADRRCFLLPPGETEGLAPAGEMRLEPTGRCPPAQEESREEGWLQTDLVCARAWMPLLCVFTPSPPERGRAP